MLSLWALVGCALGGSAIPQNVKQGVTPNLKFQQVIEDPKAFLGKTVLWGGTILKTTVHEAGTRLEMLQNPLGRDERPQNTDQSEGRFLVERPGKFLDPAIFQEGREVTVVGTITEERIQRLDEIDYRYPYVVATHIHLWPERLGGEGYPYRWHPYAYPYYYGYPYFYGYPYYYPSYGYRGYYGHHY